MSVSISAGTNIKGYTIGASASGSTSQTVSGPPYNTNIPGSSYKATHAILIGILSGTIIHETFDYVHATTDKFMEHVDRYVVGQPTPTAYTLLVADTSSHYYVGHSTRSTYKDFGSLSSYKSILQGSNPRLAYDW